MQSEKLGWPRPETEIYPKPINWYCIEYLLTIYWLGLTIYWRIQYIYAKAIDWDWGQDYSIQYMYIGLNTNLGLVKPLMASLFQISDPLYWWTYWEYLSVDLSRNDQPDWYLSPSEEWTCGNLLIPGQICQPRKLPNPRLKNVDNRVDRNSEASSIWQFLVRSVQYGVYSYNVIICGYLGLSARLPPNEYF